VSLKLFGITVNKNSVGGYTVRYPTALGANEFYEKHFSPARNYPCRTEAFRFAKCQKIILLKVKS
jgi:hypothetical protein